MNAKKILLKAARTQKQKKEVQRMSEADVADLLRSLNLSDKKEKYEDPPNNLP